MLVDWLSKVCGLEATKKAHCCGASGPSMGASRARGPVLLLRCFPQAGPRCSGGRVVHMIMVSQTRVDVETGHH